MALDSNSLKDRIRTNLQSCGFETISQNDCFIEAIAKAVIDEIKQNSSLNGTDSQGGSINGKVE